MTTTKFLSMTSTAVLAMTVMGARAHADAPPKPDNKPAVDPLKPTVKPTETPKREHCNDASPEKLDARIKLETIDLPGVKSCPMLARANWSARRGFYRRVRYRRGMTIRHPFALALSFAVALFTFSTSRADACGSDSDCAGFGRCSSGKCGTCGSDSDCNGHGKCSGGKCGACSSDSDCSNGRCSGGHCGACGSDSDCKGNGRCSDGRCGACGSDSDCSIGRCSSGHCGSCGSDSDCKGGRCSNSHCSNALAALWLPTTDGCSDGATNAPFGWRIATAAPACPLAREQRTPRRGDRDGARFAAILDALGAY